MTRTYHVYVFDGAKETESVTSHEAKVLWTFIAARAPTVTAFDVFELLKTASEFGESDLFAGGEPLKTKDGYTLGCSEVRS